MRRGFTLVELLVVIGVLGVVTAVVIPVITRTRVAGRRVTCLSNLRQVGGAFHLFASRHGGQLPDPITSQISWESSLLPYVSHPRAFACPGDDELFPSLGSSYDWRDTPDAATSLSGQPVSAPNRSSLVLAFEALPGWHSRDRICAVRLDGSASEMDYAACMLDLETANSVSIVPLK